jgi:hypothetical protein
MMKFPTEWENNPNNWDDYSQYMEKIIQTFQTANQNKNVFRLGTSSMRLQSLRFPTIFGLLPSGGQTTSCATSAL